MVPSSSRARPRSITRDPNPLCDGGANGGPSFSFQFRTSPCPAGAVSIVHPIRIDPAALDNAPYFTAFVASSLNAIPRAKAAFGGKRMFLTCHYNAIRPTARDPGWLQGIVNDIEQPCTFPFFAG